MRVKTGKANSYRYPDIAVVCGQPEFADSHVDTLLNSTLLIEILSPSTEASDRGDKFAEYRGISSLQEYLLVAQDRPCMERYMRQGDKLAADGIYRPGGDGELGRYRLRVGFA